MENEKLFDFMEKIYSEVQKGFKEVKEDIKKNTDAIISLEHELKETKKTLYDGYIQNAEGINRIEDKLEELKDRVLKR